MVPSARFLGIATLLSLFGFVRFSAAQVVQEPAEGSRLNQLVERAETLKIEFAESSDRRPQLLKSPVLRCNDPTREEVDGALWLWLDGKRPVAALCVLRYANGKWNYEHVSLTDEAISVTGRPAWSWQSPAEKRPWVTVEEPVPTAARARQSASKALARRLLASETRRGETFPLRLLERPVYSYSDEKQGLVAGDIFALSYGTNPEALVQIEAVSADGKAQWRLAFARLSAAEVTVRLDDKEIWRAEAKTANDPRATYYGVNELPEEP
jgi:hypothetical protein